MHKDKNHHTMVGEFTNEDQTGTKTVRLLKKQSPYYGGIFIEGCRYKKAGMPFFGLENAITVQPDIFSYAESARRDKLYEAADKINKQFGRKTIFHLAEGIQQPWTMKRDHLSPNYTMGRTQIPVGGRALSKLIVIIVIVVVFIAGNGDLLIVGRYD